MVHSPPEARALVQLLARYREPNSARGVFELVITAVPFVVIWALMWRALLTMVIGLACCWWHPRRAASSASS